MEHEIYGVKTIIFLCDIETKEGKQKIAIFVAKKNREGEIWVDLFICLFFCHMVSQTNSVLFSLVWSIKKKM